MTMSTSSSAYSIPPGGVGGGYNLRANTTAAQNAPPLGSGNFPNPIEKRVKLTAHTQAERSIISKAKDVLDQDDNLFFKLCDLERQIDEKIIKKQNEIAASSFRSNKLRRNLKIYISNSFCDGNSNEGSSSMASSRSMEDIQDLAGEDNKNQNNNNSNACWILRIEGKIDQSPSTSHGQGLLSSASSSSIKRSPVPTSVPKKFSHYLKSLVVEFENGEIVEWNKMTTKSSLVNCDGFEIRRGVNYKFTTSALSASEEEVLNCKIHLQFDFTPERFQLAPQLAKLLNLSLATKPAIVVALWQYIKLHKLQESDEKKIINNDAALQELFKVNRMSFSEIPMLVEPYLLPPEPVTISYQIIKGKQELNVMDEVFEIEIDVDDNKSSTLGLTNGSSTNKPTNYYNTTSRTFLSATLFRDLNFYESRVKELIDALHISKTNFNLLKSFALDPIKTSQKILKTATRDYETLIGDVPVTLEELSRAEFYENESVGDAVVDFLALNPRFLQF